MAIEFRCSQCGKLLRTPPGTEGKKAKCPECGTVLSIPAASQPAVTTATLEPEGLPPAAELDSSSENPYRSPYGMEPQVAAKGQIRPTRFDSRQALGLAWEIFKAHFGLCAAAGLIVVLLSWGTGFVLGAFQSRIPPLAYWGLYIVMQIFGWWLMLGQMKFSLKLARGDIASLADLFDAGSVLPVGIVIVIIYSLAMFVGFLLFIVPGIYLLLLLSQSLWLAIDQNAGIGEALKGSSEITQGNKLTLLAVYLVLMVLGFLVIVLTCFLGFFLFQPFAILVTAVAYLLMTGQPVAQPRAALAPAR